MHFVDTNILLYSVSTHPDEIGKASKAADILSRDDLCLSVQILQEFYVQAARSNRPGALSHEEATAFIEKWLRFPVLDITTALMRDAFVASQRWRISYWDAAVVEAARTCGCDVLLSEDLSAGQNYDGVRVENPFA